MVIFKIMINRFISSILILFIYNSHCAQLNPYVPDKIPVRKIKGMDLVWSDEFNENGKPDSTVWNYEQGFVRNMELQWYQKENARCEAGALIIEGKREKIRNTNYIQGDGNWKKSREFAEYSSSSIHTRGNIQFQFGHFEIRARISILKGSWPAIWTLGTNGKWPSCGEIDIMEYYPVNNQPTILANTAWGTNQQYMAKWNSSKIALAHFTVNDSAWNNKFHIWSMDWNKDEIKLYLDNELLNTTKLSQTINADGNNPFLQPHYLLLNLALGGNGGDPSSTVFPIIYEVDYVRVYQENSPINKGSKRRISHKSQSNY